MSGSYQKFLDLLHDVGMIESEYPVQGCYIWKPYGYKFKEKVFDIIEETYETAGYQPYQFPRIITAEPLETLAEEFYDFTQDVFWLTEGNDKNSDWYLNPTGETAFYLMFRDWISYESDLPIRAYQRGSTFRPRKSPNVLLNNTEHMDVVEAHGAFASEASLDAEYGELHQCFSDLHNRFGLPHLPLHRPQIGNKPVFVDMISYETYLPSKSKTAYLGLIYKQAQIYSEILDITFSRQDGTKDHTYQLNFGFTDRIAAAILDHHRDQQGLRLLPELAPTQIAIIPIYDGEHNVALREYAKQVKKECEAYRAKTQLSGESANTFIFNAKRRGVPLQLRLGPENLRHKTVQIVPRAGNNIQPHEISLSQLTAEIDNQFELIREEIVNECMQAFEKQIRKVTTFSEIGPMAEQRYIVKIHCCGAEACIRRINESFAGEVLGTAENGSPGECINCGDRAEVPAYFAIRTSAA